LIRANIACPIIYDDDEILLNIIIKEEETRFLSILSNKKNIV